MRDGTMQFSDNITWPITPFIGTIGVAPEREVCTSIDGQGSWGGNLDIRDVAVGNSIYLPVFHNGALFYLGDVHASQGDTEYTGTAAETCATVRVKFQLTKRSRLTSIRIEKSDSIIAIQTARPLETAVDKATQHLMEWLVNEYAFSQEDAYCLVSTCPYFRINIYQMLIATDMDFVAGAEIPKVYLS
jgi:acetamidase/formamidase